MKTIKNPTPANIKAFILKELQHTNKKHYGAFVSFEFVSYAWLPTKVNNKITWFKPYVTYGVAMHDFHNVLSIDVNKVSVEDYKQLIKTTKGQQWHKNII